MPLQRFTTTIPPTVLSWSIKEQLEIYHRVLSRVSTSENYLKNAVTDPFYVRCLHPLIHWNVCVVEDKNKSLIPSLNSMWPSLHNTSKEHVHLSFHSVHSLNCRHMKVCAFVSVSTHGCTCFRVHLHAHVHCSMRTYHSQPCWWSMGFVCFMLWLSGLLACMKVCMCHCDK